MKRHLFIALILMLFSWSVAELYAQVNFTGPELLGRPTDHSVTVNVVANQALYSYFEYGTTSSTYTGQTTTISSAANEPIEVVIDGLQANTRYYYRMRYNTDGGPTYSARDEHSFHTQRPPGSTFKFTIISDSHAMYNAQYQQAIANANSDNPDFHLDLGDTYMIDNTTNQNAVNSAYMAQRSLLYMGGIGHSAPIFIASGNHENEEGWNLDDTPFSIAVASIKARKLYYPTPVADGFYSGNTDPLTALDVATYGDQYREDYYAWEWGDVLFVVFDPFQYTMANPYGATAGEGSDDPASGDRWNWTLGLEQFNWLKQTLENSNAKYKFMFAHHMLGGTQNYVRGGAVPAHMFEWGGYNADGTTWGWDTKRPGWDDDPIRQLMIDNGVSAFFHGHDHQYAYEVRDGIVYLSMPRPSTGLDFNYYSESNQYTERVLSSPGHLRVTVTPSQTTVEYITSSNSSGAVQHSFTILPNTPPTTYDLTMAVDPVGGGTTNPSVGDHTYTENTVVNITATPATGYVFDHWSGDVTGSVNPTSITMDGTKSITAHFTVVPTYSLTMAVEPSGSGTTTPAIGEHTYSENTVVNITATPTSGYVFDHWSGDLTGSTNPTSITMNGEKSVTAHFVAIPSYILTMAVDPPGGGTTTPAVGDHSYLENTVVNITATPASGYVFDHWDGACTGSSVCSVTMDADKSVIAVFVVNSATSAATPSNATPTVGQQIVVSINVDMTNVVAADNKLGSFTGSLVWDPAVLAYASHSGLLAGFTGAVNTANVGSGQIAFNGANATGTTGDFVVFQITFDVVGTGTSALDLEYTAMAAALTFADLLPILTVTDGQVVASSGILGDVNDDDVVNSTDALIILSCDVGIDVSGFCPMNCGDINGDGLINSTDALIILSYDVGMSVPFPVGEPGCPSSVTPCPGCNP